MKHIIKKDEHGFTAYCTRPGCSASLQGGIVEKMTQDDLDNFFDTPCPYFFKAKNEWNLDQRKEYLINHAKKEIKDWKNLIEYWVNIDAND